MSVGSFVHLATHSNVLFRVDLSDGRRMVLRMGGPTVNTRQNIDIEVAWLSELVHDPQLNVAAPVPASDGRLVVDLDHESGAHPCVLFTWVPGEPLGEGAGPSGYRAMGRVSGRLHRHGDWRPRPPLELRQWNRTFYYPADLDPVVFTDFSYDHLFFPIRAELAAAAAVTDDYIRRRWSESDPMVVHGDLHEWNVHLALGRAWAIDFEDVMMALPAQDIATSLYGARTRPDLTSVITAFRRGYEEERRWPVPEPLELEMYWAARQVMLMNYAGRILSANDARDYFDQVGPWLRAFLARTG